MLFCEKLPKKDKHKKSAKNYKMTYEVFISNKKSL